MKGSRNHADELIIERQFEPLDYKLSTLTANLQTELDVNQPDLIKPSPQLRDSPALRTMSLRQATKALQDISNPLDIVASSPPPVYTLIHLLGLGHNIMPLAAPMPQELPVILFCLPVVPTALYLDIWSVSTTLQRPPSIFSS